MAKGKEEKNNPKRRVNRRPDQPFVGYPSKPLDYANMTPEEIERHNIQLQEASRAISKIIGWNG